MSTSLLKPLFLSGGGTVSSSDILDSTEAGRALLTAANAAAQQAIIVTNESVNAAIEEDPAASRAALELEGGTTPTIINITESPYLAIADGKFGDGAVMSSVTTPTVLTLSGANFSASGLPGKFIRVVGAGAAGVDLVTTIASRDSATQLTLTDPCLTTVASAQVFYGTDNTTAIQDALDAAYASGTARTVIIPAGKYLCNVVSYPTVRIQGVGTMSGQSAYNSTNLPAETKCTYLLPALATEAVIRFEQATYSGGAVISDMILVGGDGTSAGDRKGTGIEIGETLDSINGPMPGSWRLERLEISGFNRGITASRTWDSVVEGVQINYCNVGYFGGELDVSDVEKTTGPSDGITFIGCGSNYTDVVLDLRGCKQITISCGDFNNMEKFVVLEESNLIVTGVNIEGCSSVMFHLYGANRSALDVAWVMGIGWTGDFIWNDSTSANPHISVRSGPDAQVYKTAATTGYPLDLPRGTTIKRYADSTYATLTKTEFWNNISRFNFERENLIELREAWSGRTGASPYGQLGWTVTNIAGTTALAAQANSMSVYQDAPSESARVMPENDVANFYTNWKMSWIFKFATVPTSTAFRIGLYSRDGSAAMIPVNGIGLRADTVTAGDTNVQLEVIVGSAIQTVVDMGVAISALDDVYYELVLQKQGSVVYAHLKNTNSGALAASQVSYSATMPASTGYCLPGVFLSGSAAQLVYLRRMLFEQLG